MIFISHNSKDKPVIEPIAIRLASIYGQDNVFYDSWSVQPGDGIIEKMEEGLKKCKFFFFFISANSLNSEMVKLEWQNMLMKKAKNSSIKFIPVRIDKTELPILLTQTLFIDLYNYGLDVTLRQIVDVIEGRNTYQQTKTFSNLIAYKSYNGKKIRLECRAEYYLEPISSFLFCTQQDLEDISCNVIGVSMYNSSESLGAQLENGYKTNILSFSITRGTLPGFPFVVEFESKSGKEFDIEMVMHEKHQGRFESIPIRLE